MTTRARFSIGIDLGTTNTALAFAPLDADDVSAMLPIPQLESAVALGEAPTLPSFLYLPEDAAPRGESGDPVDDRWIVGRFARAKAAETPGRVVHSAKSWLVHHQADREARFLPWGSDDVPTADKMSPVDAAATVLRYLREAWNERFGSDAAGDRFEEQEVTITVPASFDAAAQRLTLAAARTAGYPDDVRLLEEPQAAFYHWLEGHPGRSAWDAIGGGTAVRHVLVVDVGGGTSDFSLFASRAGDGDDAPAIERIAVSDHILLGGDNMDLALAHRLEPHLSTGGEALTGRQWEYLVARCRELKEHALATSGPAGDAFTVAIPGRGSRLIAQSVSAQLTREDVETLLLDGFFPHCDADEYPIRTRGALREQGLPFARDPAVTRHLADFLRGRPAVDAVLFNGGALAPQRLRDRIRASIGAWQAGDVPIELANAEPDLAVARGAARFGGLVARRGRRIEAGAAQAIFLRAQRRDAGNGDAAALLCVLPHGAPTERTYAVSDRALALRVNVPVRFETFVSARHEDARAGDLVAWNDRDFSALPPLETAVHVPQTGGASAADRTVPVTLSARLSELGRLEIACVSSDPALPAAWPLAFHVRPGSYDAGGPPALRASSSAGPEVPAAALDAAHGRITTLFARGLDRRDRLTATRLLKSLETLLNMPKHQWNAGLVRALWSALERCADDRERSVEHEEAWLILAGYLLRPGFGVPRDDARIDRLWSVRETGRRHDTRGVRVQEWVLWRRVAGGLSAERQADVLETDLTDLRERPNPAPELVLLAGSLERIAVPRKIELIDRFVSRAAALAGERQHATHYFGALGLLLNRAPLYAGPETVVPPAEVQRAFEAFSPLDWDGRNRADLQALFLRAARVVDNRSLDLGRALRGRIADKLERSGVAASRTAALRDYVPLPRADRAGGFGESLPPGLVLGEASPAGIGAAERVSGSA